jgi:serine/threonine protein kinase
MTDADMILFLYYQVAAKLIIKSAVTPNMWVKNPKDPYGPAVTKEIAILMQLDHPNVVKYLGHFQDEKYIILVTEMHGTEWSLSNPALSRWRNPGLKQPKNMMEHIERFKRVTKRITCKIFGLRAAEQSAPCDLFECIGKSSNACC